MQQRNAGDPVTEDEPAREQEPSSAESAQVGSAQRTTVMLLGSAESRHELEIAFERLGAEVIAVERDADARAHGVADKSAVVETADTDELAAVGGRPQPNFVVMVGGVVAADALAATAETGFSQVFPAAPGAALTADREALRRLATDELGLPTAPSWFAGSVEELQAIADHVGYPLRVQPVSLAAGPGESVISGPNEVAASWQRAMSAGGRLARSRVLVETVVEVDFYVTLLAVRSDGPKGALIDFCTPIGHRGAAGDVRESWQPQHMSVAASDAAKSIAARIVKALGGRGVFGVELMVRGDEVYFCEASTSPYESALVTLRTQRLSVFELQARAILGLTTDTIMISPGAAQVFYLTAAAANGAGVSGDALAEALAVPESDVRVFGHHPRRGRLAVAVVTAADVSTARERVGQASAALRKLWQP